MMIVCRHSSGRCEGFLVAGYYARVADVGIGSDFQKGFFDVSFFIHPYKTPIMHLSPSRYSIQTGYSHMIYDHPFASVSLPSPKCRNSFKNFLTWVEGWKGGGVKSPAGLIMVCFCKFLFFFNSRSQFGSKQPLGCPRQEEDIGLFTVGGGHYALLQYHSLVLPTHFARFKIAPPLNDNNIG